MPQEYAEGGWPHKGGWHGGQGRAVTLPSQRMPWGSAAVRETDSLEQKEHKEELSSQGVLGPLLSQRRG